MGPAALPKTVFIFFLLIPLFFFSLLQPKFLTIYVPADCRELIPARFETAPYVFIDIVPLGLLSARGSSLASSITSLLLPNLIFCCH